MLMFCNLLKFARMFYINHKHKITAEMRDYFLNMGNMATIYRGYMIYVNVLATAHLPLPLPKTVNW